MDVVHHAFIGGAGMLALGAAGQELAGLGFLAGSVFPDLDVAFMAAGKRFYLKRHQGPTHSLPFAPLYAAALTAAMAALGGWQWAFFWGALAGLAVHVALDLSNTFGIQILWPLSARRFCADAVFFVDLGAWTLTLAFFAIALAEPAAMIPAACAYAALFAAYVLGRWALQRRVRRRTGALVAIPSSWNPFAFFLLREHADGLETSRYDALTGRLGDVRVQTRPPPEVMALARTSSVFRDMSSILRALTVTSVERAAERTTLVAEDLAVRNFGGRFGRTQLRFDAEGRLEHEVANI
jgi:membrane-bound metal-dependent hydrolase YbcI (DUF457 family)